jgi:hypothetical protein
VTGYSVAWDDEPHTATGQCLGVVGETLAGLNLASTTHTAAGTYTNDPWTFTDATGNYTNTAGVVTDVIDQAAQTITFTNPPDKTYGDAPFGLTATASSGLPVTFTSTTTDVCTVSTSTVTLLIAGNCTIRASQDGDASWAPAPFVDRTVAVAKATLTVTAANKAVDFDEPAPAYTFAYSGFQGADDEDDITTPPTCGSAYEPGDDVDDYPITCAGGADDQYTFNYVAGTLTVSKADQTVAFDGDAPTGATVGGSSTQTATASSGLLAAVTVDASAITVCAILGDIVTYQLPGECVLNANQAGNDNWNAAPQVQRSFTVSLRTQTITFAALAGHPYGDTFAVDATATSGLTVTFSSITTGVCTASGSDVTVVNVGTCTILASQDGNAIWEAATPVDQSFAASTRPITVTAVTDSREADGTTDSAGVPILTAGTTLATGDTGTFTQAFDSQFAGTDKTLTPTGIVEQGLADVTARYAITFLAVSTGTISPAALDSIAISPSSSSITVGDSRAYTAEGFDAFGNSRGDVTADAAFTIAPDGSCTLASCTATEDGPHTVTGMIGAIDDDASLTVNPGAATTLEVTATSPQAAGVSFAVTVTARDAFGNIATGYTGTVALTSTAPDVMPTDHTFIPGDAGTFAFTVAIAAPASVSFTATDTVTASITGASGAITIN